MRFFVFIALMFFMAVSPAVAAASCVSMGSNETMTDGTMAEDCDMSTKDTQSHDAGCAAACALICPGFYAGPDLTGTETFALDSLQYASPAREFGVAQVSHLDPPPPRV